MSQKAEPVISRIAIMASGNGSNAEAIIRYFAEKPQRQVSLVLSNRKNAGVLKRAENLNVPGIYLQEEVLKDDEALLKLFSEYQITHLVLAGYLKQLSGKIINSYDHRIFNIHPALLPAFGGKGMYGIHVHRAVITSGEKFSGITIHEVIEEYDKGRILFQARCEVMSNDSPESLSARIQKLEHHYYPKVLDLLLDKPS